MASLTEAVFSRSGQSAHLSQPMEAEQQSWSPEGDAGPQSPLSDCLQEDILPLSCIAMCGLQSAPLTRHSAPEVTFTPTAVGLRLGEGQGPGLSQDI